MRRYGMHRVGWMTWEFGPAPKKPELPPHPRGPIVGFADSVVFIGDMGGRGWREIGRTDPGSSITLLGGRHPDETVVFPRLAGPGHISATFTLQPAADPIGELRRAANLALLYEGRHELHCAQDGADALVRLARSERGFAVDPAERLLGIDVIVEGDMPPSQWQIRDEDGAIIDGGMLLLL
jgi:hypothetical protein